jgi:hypothetical protein
VLQYVRHNHRKPYRAFALITSAGVTLAVSGFWDKYNILDGVTCRPEGLQLFQTIDKTVKGMREVLDSVR